MKLLSFDIQGNEAKQEPAGVVIATNSWGNNLSPTLLYDHTSTSLSSLANGFHSVDLTGSFMTDLENESSSAYLFHGVISLGLRLLELKDLSTGLSLSAVEVIQIRSGRHLHLYNIFGYHHKSLLAQYH